MQTIVFDLDNTLVRCTSTDEAVIDIVRRHGADGDDAAILDLVGDAASDWRIVEQCVAPGNRNVAYREILEVNARLATTAVCRDGLREALRALARRYPLFVASGRDRASIDVIFETLGLQNLFADVAAAAPDSPSKPDALVLTNLLRRHHLAPAAAVYLGDKDIDLELARRAGVAFIGAALYQDRLPDSIPKVRSALEITRAINELAANRETSLLPPTA